MESLLPLYQSLSTCISLLAKNPDPFKELIAGMFGPVTTPWMLSPLACAPEGAMSSAASSAGSLPHVFFEFTLQLVSANCCFLPSVLQALVRALVPSSDVSGTAGAQRPSGAAVVNAASTGGATEPVQSLLAFQLLKQVLRLVPAGVAALFRVLSDHFPHKRHLAHVHAAYVAHLLHIATELPPLQDRIFAIIVEKMILIDVRAAVQCAFDEHDPRRRGVKAV